MWISRRTDYATRAVLALALVTDDRPRKIHELAELTSTPESVLEQLLPQLRGAGIVRSERGPSGGYRLNHAPGDVTLGRVVRLIQGPLAPISCATRSSPEPCPMDAGCALQLPDPLTELRRIFDAKGAVGAERGKHARWKSLIHSCLVKFERIGWIVGAAHDFNFELAQYALRRQIVACKLPVGLVPDARGGLFVQEVFNTEIAAKFQMSPVIERIAQGIRNRLRPREELFIRLGVAGAITLIHPICSHGTPLVVIALEPNLKKIAEAPVFGDIFGGNMAVIIDDWLRVGIALVQSARRPVLQKKVLVHE